MTRLEVVRVALDMPLRRVFDYLPPNTLGPPERHWGVEPGVRVRVPFGRQRLVGVVVELAGSSDLPEERLKPILEILDPRPILDTAALGLLRWAAEYYHHPIGEVFSAALPKALRLGASSSSTEERWSATVEGREARQRGEPKRAPKQRMLLEFLVAHDGSTADTLTENVPGWRDAARSLIARGWIGSMEVAPEPNDPPSGAPASGPTLAEEQRNAVEVIGKSLDHYGTFVLHGVTGSGKTEVYLQLVERVLTQGRRALVLVPEIGLTPQLVGRFRERFGVPMAVLHSALTDHERLL